MSETSAAQRAITKPTGCACLSMASRAKVPGATRSSAMDFGLQLRSKHCAWRLARTSACSTSALMSDVSEERGIGLRIGTAEIKSVRWQKVLVPAGKHGNGPRIRREDRLQQKPAWFFGCSEEGGAGTHSNAWTLGKSFGGF